MDTASTVYEYGFITASHCTTTMGIVDDDVAYQPKGGPRIGQEVLDPAWSSSLSDCPSGRECRYSDAAIVKYDDPDDAHLGYIERTSEYSIQVDHSSQQWEIASEDSQCYFADDCSLQGTQVHKVGRTTGWTWETIDRTCKDKDLSSAGQDTGKTVLCVDRANSDFANTVDGGDSGSAVWERGTSSSSWVRLHGIVVGADGSDKFWFSRIHNARAELGDFGTLPVSGGPH